MDVKKMSLNLKGLSAKMAISLGAKKAIEAALLQPFAFGLLKLTQPDRLRALCIQ
jgi:hypothetical protein